MKVHIPVDGADGDASSEALRALDIEMQRQQAMVAALWRDEGALATCGAMLAPQCSVAPARGLEAYRVNGGAVAERALAAAFPVVQALVRADTFARLARAFWHAEPPWRGDLATIVDRLPGFIEHDPQLADVPYLADVARLECALARAEAAADASDSSTSQLESLGLLAQHEASELAIDLAPGADIIVSRWPIATIWRAHRSMVVEHLAREAIAARRGEIAFVWRDQWVGRLDVIDEPTAAFLQAVLDGRALDACHDLALRRDADWSFEGWLTRAIEARWHAGVRIEEKKACPPSNHSQPA